MDGAQKPVNTSLRRKLALPLSAVILFLALAAGLASFYNALTEANELQDAMLYQAAALVTQQPNHATPLLENQNSLKRVDPESTIVVQPIGASTTLKGPDALPLSAQLSDGLHDLEFDGTGYRTLIKTLENGQRIALTQETAVRDEIAQDSALRTVMPLLILVPMLLLIINSLIGRMLKPLHILARQVNTRKEDDLTPLDGAGLPHEIRPFVDAINQQLSKIGQSIEMQRRFIADAAHELKTPLTALSLQANRLDQAHLPADASEKLTALRQSIDRTRNLVEQLLGLAQAQSTRTSDTDNVVVDKVFRRVLEDLLPVAQNKNLDIGMRTNQDIVIPCSESDFYKLVRNLTDNAIRYTPKNGRIDLNATQTSTHTIIEVEDNGPGIPATERENVMKPFYRILGTEQTGSGLGLSIVQTIASNWRMSVELTNSTQFTRGLKVRVAIEHPPSRSPNG